MIAAPRWRLTERVVSSAWIFLAPIALYAALVIPGLASVLPVVARPELDPVRALLGSPLGATAAWAHFLAFDLFVGRFIFLDAKAHGFPGPGHLAAPRPHAAPRTARPGRYLGYRASAAADAYARLGALVRQAAAESRPLMRLGAASLGLLLFALVAQLFDDRTVLGASVWAKPAKFGASVALTAVRRSRCSCATSRSRRAAAVSRWGWRPG